MQPTGHSDASHIPEVPCKSGSRSKDAHIISLIPYLRHVSQRTENHVRFLGIFYQRDVNRIWCFFPKA